MREGAEKTALERNRYGELVAGIGAPLVSVVIRSIGRSTLADALDSVARQTYPRIEVVLVNAVGPSYPPPPPGCGGFAVRFIDASEPRKRSRAANAGLAAAQGELIIFLDDDDWFDPCHIVALVAALGRAPESRVAYAGVRTAGLEPEEAVLDRPFSLPRLRFGNYIPLHAGIFHRSLLDEGCAFDEELDHYEDWDFWLQASERTTFVHVEQVSAVYRATGASGVGLLPDRTVQREATARIHEKWRTAWARLSPAELFAGSEAEIEAAVSRIRVLEERLRQVETRAADLEGELLHQAGSWSWRITAPLRWLSGAIRRWRSPIRPAAVEAGAAVPEPSRPARGAYAPAPMVSVVLPVFNACRTRPEYLAEAIGSVASQSYANLELIIVDDGSTDGTSELCRSHIARIESLPVTLARQANGGQSSARNTGVALARGEWVSFIDQDDVFLPDKLERVVALLDDSVDLVYTDADTVDSNGAPLLRGIHRRHGCGAPHPKRCVDEILFKDIYIMPGLMTIRRSRLIAVGGYDDALSGYEDDDLFLRLFAPGRLRYLPESTLRWRMHEENYSQSARMVTSRLRYWKKLMEHYTDGGNDRRRSVGVSRRFFREFIRQAVWQLKDGVAMWELNYTTSKEILPYLPVVDRVAFTVFQRPLFALARRSTAVRRLLRKPRRVSVSRH